MLRTWHHSMDGWTSKQCCAYWSMQFDVVEACWQSSMLKMQAVTQLWSKALGDVEKQLKEWQFCWQIRLAWILMHFMHVSEDLLAAPLEFYCWFKWWPGKFPRKQCCYIVQTCWAELWISRWSGGVQGWPLQPWHPQEPDCMEASCHNDCRAQVSHMLLLPMLAVLHHQPIMHKGLKHIHCHLQDQGSRML